MRKTTCLLIALLCLPVTAQAETVIKLATLAPRGSIWMRYFDKMKAEVAKATGGAVKIRYYPGQIQGAESDVVRKMRTGQLHGGAFTSAGLALLNPQVLVLQLPMLFSTYAQVDRVRDALAPELEKAFSTRGHVLLGWSELGWIHVFSKHPISGLADLRKQRMWVQSDDPLAKAMMRELGLKPRPLAIPQVYPALSTGMVDAVYNSPIGCLALQWHSKLRYMAAEPLTLGIGATVISKTIFDKLAPDQPLEVVFHHDDGSEERGRVTHSLNEDQVGWFRAGSALNVLRGA